MKDNYQELVSRISEGYDPSINILQIWKALTVTATNEVRGQIPQLWSPIAEHNLYQEIEAPF